MMETLKRLFWSLRYHLYSRDLYAPLRAGRGTEDSPLSMDDLAPLMKALRRIDGAPQIEKPADVSADGHSSLG
jgi:hypothetical protein